MIVEIRTELFKPGSLPEVLKLYAQALPAREKFSRPAGFFTTDPGLLNQVVQIWAYENFDHRSQVMEDVAKAKIWPPELTDHLMRENSELLRPAPFSPKLEPRELGGLYEMRRYTLAPGEVPAIIERWTPMIEGRIKLSPLAGAFYAEFGALNIWTHIWAYKDALERNRIRADAVARGVWPPKVQKAGGVVQQESTYLTPTAFSPLR